ncbi:MAG: type II toxin-antitoxin system Phd/YefM family antitoxin [Oligoflexales bacterium]|nr:type II toxin-antitoxin system Phd/YefM family antitoxin [Oligoflexales bacterium]
MWNIREAKSKFSKVVSMAQEEPQTITNRGHAHAVIVSAKEFETMKNELKHLKKILKKSQGKKIQRMITKSFEEANVEVLDFETPTRPLPEF